MLRTLSISQRRAKFPGLNGPGYLSILAKQRKVDPSRTGAIRRSYEKEFVRRFDVIATAIKKAIVDLDVLGLKTLAPNLPSKRRWANLPPAQRSKAFGEWLTNLVDDAVVNGSDIGGLAVPGGWQRTFIRRGYVHGVLNTQAALERAGRDIASKTAGQIFNSRFHRDRLEALYSRNLDELDGVTSQMSSKIKRIVADSMLRGANPKEAARDITKQVGISRNRASMIARTETIRAAAVGQLASFEEMGERNIQLDAEFVSSGDERVCIASGKTPVLTINGWKKIKDIKVGDLVLTHKDRFRKVTATHQRKYSGRYVTVKPGRCLGSVTLTYGHLVLTEKQGWKPIEKVGSQALCYYAVPCPGCGTPVPAGKPTLGSKPALCSLSCVVREWNKKRWSDPKQRERHIQKNKRMWAEPGRKERHPRMMKRLNPMADPKVRKRISDTHKQRWIDDYERLSASMSEANKRRFAKGDHPFQLQTIEDRIKICKKAAKSRIHNSYGGSYLEKKMRWFLEKQGIHFKAQWFFTYDCRGRTKRGFADFYVPGRRLVIECDGPDHLKPEVVEKDTIRDTALLQRKIQVLRFTDVEIRKDFKSVANRIREFCCTTFLKPKQLVHKTMKSPSGLGAPKVGILMNRTVYNLAVEEDRSFIANGLVVHNCPECEALDGQIFSIDEARGLIPQHPNCRCSFAPVQK